MEGLAANLSANGVRCVRRGGRHLARKPTASRAVPPNAAVDASRIAIVVTTRVRYLVTWNFRHIANASMRSRIERACRSEGYEPPVICTPDELMEIHHGNP